MSKDFSSPLPLRTKAVLPADHATAPSGCSATLSIQRRLASVASSVDLALVVERNDLAVIAAHHDALAVGRRAQDAAAMDGDLRNLAFVRSTSGDVLLGADKGGVLAEKMHRDDRHADRERPHPVGDRDDGGGIRARIEFFHHVVIQLSKPSRMVCSGNSRPMKTRRLSRGSPSFQARW